MHATTPPRRGYDRAVELTQEAFDAAAAGARALGRGLADAVMRAPVDYRLVLLGARFDDLAAAKAEVAAAHPDLDPRGRAFLDLVGAALVRRTPP